MRASSAGIQIADIWAALTAGMTTVGSVGKLIADDVDDVLEFTDVYDEALAAGAYVTPTINGLFYAVNSNSTKLDVEVYSEIHSGGAWLTPPDETGITSLNIVVGKASKIRFQNNDGAAHTTLVRGFGG